MSRISGKNFLILLASLSFFGFQSQSRIDSLKSESIKSHSDSLSIAIYNEIAEEFSNDYKLMDSSIHYAQLAYDHALNANENVGKARAAYNLGYGYDLSGKVNLSLQYYGKAKQYFADINDTEGVATCMHGVGIAYYFQGNYGQALKSYHEVVAYARENNLLEREANSLLNLGVIYRKIENYDKAIEIYEENITLQKRLGDSTTLAMVYNNLGVVYTYIDQFERAEVYLDSSLVIYQEMNDSFNLAAVYITLGDLYLESGTKMQLAKNYLLQGYGIMRGFDDNVYQSKALLYLGRVEGYLKNYTSAKDYLLEGLKVLEGAELEEIKRDLSFELSKVYEAQGNSPKAFYHLKNAYRLNDTINTQERLRYTEEMEAKYENEKKEKEIASLNAEQAISKMKLSNAQRLSFYLILALSIFAALLLGLYRFYRRIRKQRETISATLAGKEKLLDNLRKAQERIIQSEKMASLGQLTASIAHEINNPNNFISTSSESLLLDFKDLEPLLLYVNNLKEGSGIEALNHIIGLRDEIDLPLLNNEMQQLLNGVSEGAERTNDIIKGLKHFSHPGKLEKNPSNIETDLDVVLGLMQTKFKDRIEVEKAYGGIPEIMVTKNQLSQVFINIISNSVDAMIEKYANEPGKGLMKIKTGQTDDEVFIGIKDNGPGIPKEYHSKIFDPFFTTKDVGAGVGLGLSISYGIIQQHKGRIELMSEGEGAEFIIWLPKNTQPIS